MAIQITNRAKEKIIELAIIEAAERGLAEQASLYLRISVIAGCCASPQYSLEWTSETKDGDVWLEVVGIKILAENKYWHLLENITLDYVMLGFADAGFKIENPDMKPQCGCGSLHAN
ncbi:MAG TPA: iron-sulfur cluster assembly accessory protein [Candidatus Paceibacterota bacterium]|uniref:Core domain-containing protein n=1 Tax=Candidatus Roizmanbacteria bacterium RIFCSPHIGHO2_01_FULL_39_12b TaxID=1802030 RepID=A0A1F7G8H6_9BACT|nr:MAG: hypothetical protein A2690_00015 [Candidatus Roizmanbacteria bacterium RIFCSPHIGHO2_01_FULL_39_12b]